MFEAESVQIPVDGWRAKAADRKAVHEIPAEQLPPLTQQQREVARKLQIAEVDYARSAVAGQRTAERLLQKAEQLARLLQAKVGPRVRIQGVTLKTVEHRFEVEANSDGTPLALRIDEDLVDDLFEGGALEAEQRLGRVVEMALPSGALK